MIHKIFAIPVYSTDIEGDTVLNIKNQVLKYIKDYPSHFKEAWSCNTTSNILYKGDDKLDLPLLENEIKKHIKEYSKIFEYEDSHTLKFKDVWVNIAPPGAFQEEHAHTDPYKKVLYSGVYYIKTEENCGNIIFHTELDAHWPQMIKNNLFHNSSVKAEEGRLVIFPAWLKHRVIINKSQSDRISVSFNIELLELNPKTNSND